MGGKGCPITRSVKVKKKTIGHEQEYVSYSRYNMLIATLRSNASSFTNLRKHLLRTSKE